MRASELPVYYNAVDILERNLAQRADKTALYSPDRELTFQQVSDEANRVGKALKTAPTTVPALVKAYADDDEPWCLLDTHHRHMESRKYNFEFAARIQKQLNSSRSGRQMARSKVRQA